MPMFQLFLRARVNNFFKGRRSGSGFKTRSSERDAEADQARIASIIGAIENALQAAEKEHRGLSDRLDDFLARAAVSMGNASDEYLDREPHRTHHQNLFEAEIS